MPALRQSQPGPDALSHPIYEATSLNGLKDSLELMRGPHRLGENASWHAWDSGPEPAITWEDAAGSRLVKVRQRQP